MPLTYANMGTVYRVHKVGGRDRIRSHLQNLGFVENEPVLVRQSAGGNLIVEVKEDASPSTRDLDDASLFRMKGERYEDVE